MTQRRCHSCGHFHDKRENACPECKTPKFAFNPAVVSAQFASALNAKADWAVKNG